MPILLKECSANTLNLLPREKTVFFFPVGPLEDHGPHLPLGLDLALAESLSLLHAQKLETEMLGWSGVLMPTAPLGIDSDTTQIALTIRPHVLRDWLVDVTRSLMRLGFHHFVCFSGHLGPKQLTAIEDAGKLIKRYAIRDRWKKRFKGEFRSHPTELLSGSSALVTWQIVSPSLFWPDPLEHGGEQDTSIALQVVPNLVAPHYHTLPGIVRHPNRWIRNWKRRSKQLAGYWGHPHTATAEKGQKHLQEKVSTVFPKLRMIWEGAPPKSLFRSWYSIFPPNQSFFKSWLLALLLILVFVVWAFIVSATLNSL